MQVGIPKEIAAGEQRVAASLETIRQFIDKGLSVAVQAGAGEGASIPDPDFEAAGAELVGDAKALYGASDIVLKVQKPMEGPLGHEVDLFKEGSLLIGVLQPLINEELLGRLAARHVTAFAVDMVPRIARAQSMDVLSSQSNIAGYKAVIEAASTFKRFFPMLMTAAGSVFPARVLVLGAGVAGLQAIATARRLGARVAAFDVRPVVKEQAQSLGADFLEIELEVEAESSGGYAKELSKEAHEKEQALVGKAAAESDIVITTALIPGKQAPILVTADMVNAMKPGSVIVDLAAEMGGNCELTQPGKVVQHGGVTLIGHTNYPSLVAGDATQLYARNLRNFLFLLLDENGALKIDTEDEVVAGTLVTRDGSVLLKKPA